MMDFPLKRQGNGPVGDPVIVDRKIRMEIDELSVVTRETAREALVNTTPSAIHNGASKLYPDDQ